MTALAWYGLRAYSSDRLGCFAVRIRRVSDNAEQDFATLVNGSLDIASIATFLSATSGTFVTLYDHSGNSLHVAQATAANQAVYNATGTGTKPTADFAAASAHRYQTGVSITQAQPLTISAVVKTVANGSRQNVWQSTDDLIQIGWNLGGDANLLYIFAGSALSATANAGAFHAIQAVFNAASSDANIDGSPTTGSASTSGIATPIVIGGTSAGGIPFNGAACEIGVWAGAFSGAESSAMSSNQHAYWGF